MPLSPEEIRKIARTVVDMTPLEFRAFRDALDDLGKGGDGDDLSGVREPRRPLPSSGSATVEAERE